MADIFQSAHDIDDSSLVIQQTSGDLHVDLSEFFGPGPKRVTVNGVRYEQRDGKRVKADG